MIRFFPMPYLNESMYSIFVRYDKNIGNDNYFETAKDLIGDMNLNINFSFCRNLDYLCNELPKGTIYNPEFFIKNHSVLPVYKPFIPKNRYENALKNFKNGSIASALSIIGHTAGTLFSTSFLKYCPKCISEDKNDYEEAYIHNTHQIDGNLVCSKHKTLLQIWNAPKMSDNILYDINKLNIDNLKICVSNNIIEELYDLSCDIDNLICNYENLPYYEVTREKYFSMIDDKGYLSKGGLVNQTSLHRDFTNYYSKELLDILNSNVDINNENSWLRIITRRKLKTVHPIRNLLFIRFLFEDFNSFIKYNQHKTFGTKEIRGNYNPKLLDEKNSRYDIDLEEPYKISILNLIKDEPYISRTEISRRLRKEYLWLSKHSKKWLEEVLPKPLKHKDFYNNNRINWNERDLTTYNKVEEAIDEILRDNVLNRINITYISKQINYKALNRDIDKMPHTKLLINEYTESLPDYHKRKIKIAFETLIKDNENLKSYMVLRKASIPDKYYHDYDDYINQLLDRNNNY